MSVRLRPGRTVRPHELRLLTDIAEQAAVAFRNARLQAELAARVAMLDESTAQIAASRLRLIEAGDAERRRLEGAISREVTPLLSSLAADLGPAPPGGRPATDTLVDRATAALDALRELTRGIFPTILTRAGLGPALSAYVARLGRSGVLDVDASVAGQRFPARTEAAAYFCCTQALAGGDAHVSLALVGAHVQVEVTGVTAGAMDLAAVEDRVEALGGTLELAEDAARSGDVRLLVRLPVATDPFGQRPVAAAAHS
jgi:hypothetical protein